MLREDSASKQPTETNNRLRNHPETSIRVEVNYDFKTNEAE